MINPNPNISSVAKAIKTIHPLRLRREILIPTTNKKNPNQPYTRKANEYTERKEEGRKERGGERTHELYSAFEGTAVDAEPNLEKAVVEPGAVEDSSPSCFKASSLRWKEEAIGTLLRLRMKPWEEAPTKRGRNKGRQAPTMPMDDSTMAQYTRGEFRSAGWC